MLYLSTVSQYVLYVTNDVSVCTVCKYLILTLPSVQGDTSRVIQYLYLYACITVTWANNLPSEHQISYDFVVSWHDNILQL